MSKRIQIAARLALFAVGLFALTAAAQETYIGLLGETVESIGIGGGELHIISLYDTPREDLIYAPVGEDIQYGTIKLGNGADTLISIAVRLGPEPLLWIDANNNEDLYDDGASTPDVIWSQHSRAWYREITVSYWEDGAHYTSPYVLRIQVTKFGSNWDLLYIGFCTRKGLIQIGPALHTIWLSDLDSDGLFNDFENLAIGIDNDGDGVLCLDFSSPEWFFQESPFLEPGIVQIDNMFYELIDVSSDGRLIELASSDVSLEPLPILQVGHPAPLFTVNTVTGEKIDLSKYVGQPILLLFAPMFQLYPEHIDYCSQPEWSGDSDCFFGFGQPKTRGAWLAIERTQEIIEEAIQWPDDLGFEILLVATDLSLLSPDTPTSLDQLDLSFPIIWDEALPMQYRTAFYGAFVINHEGSIVARDGWSYRYDATGRLLQAELDPLSFLEISEILAGLLEDEL
ncbi:hypothetical protein KAT84_00500 [Candidatus Bipolaricaulota bacterium]|nr:hypothetical protein [Candidatus Bipolaricaulota bacterium]